jgi:hypothetical protein
MGFRARTTGIRAFVGLLAAALALVVLVQPASATNVQYYAASASASSVTAGSPVTFTIQNCAYHSPSVCPLASNAVLGSATIALAGAGLPDGPVSVTTSNGKSWTGTVTGGVVKLAAVTDSDRLAAGRSVSVSLVLTKAGTYTGVTHAYYYKNFTSGPGSYSFQRKGSDPVVTVVPAPFTLTFSAFTPSPGVAEVNGTIFSNPATSAPVTVTAADVYGNRPADGTVVTLSLAGSPSPAGGTFTPPSPAPSAGTVGGTATFSSLKVSTVATGYALRAVIAAPMTQPYFDSGPFDVVGDLAVCSGASCSNSATSTQGQTTSTALTKGAGQLSGELLTTSFLSTPLTPPAGACPGFTPIGQGVDVAVVGGNPALSQPSFTITFTIPHSLAVPGRPAWKYNICLGATAFTPTAPWKTKTWNFFTWPWSRMNAIDDGTGRFWGLVPSCFFVAGTDEDFLHWVQVPATNPCVSSKKRLPSGDIQLVLKQPFPWDPRASTG